jgi:hypothetical protein
VTGRASRACSSSHAARGPPGAASLGAISAKDALRRRTETTPEEDVLLVLDPLPVGLFACQHELRAERTAFVASLLGALARGV